MFSNGQQSISGVSINNAPIGNITPSTGSFTNLNANAINASPIGTVTPAVGSFTSLNANAINASPIGTVTPAVASFTTSRVTLFTVATLPVGVTGMTSCVSDALAPVSLAAVAGGGTVTVSVFFNGAQWIVQ